MHFVWQLCCQENTTGTRIPPATQPNSGQFSHIHVFHSLYFIPYIVLKDDVQKASLTFASGSLVGVGFKLVQAVVYCVLFVMMSTDIKKIQLFQRRDMSWQLGKIRFYWYSNSTESVFVYLGVIQCLNCRQIHPFPTKLLGSEYWYFIQMLNLLSHFVGSYPCSKVSQCVFLWDFSVYLSSKSTISKIISNWSQMVDKDLLWLVHHLLCFRNYKEFFISLNSSIPNYFIARKSGC